VYPKMANTAINISNSTKLNIYSYNLKGINQGRSLLTDLCTLKNAHIIFVQEHWQTPANLPKILNFHENFIGYGISAMNNVISKGILRGRPYGGVATLIHSSLADRVVCLKCEERFVVITLCNVMFINVYMPCSSLLLQIISRLYNLLFMN